MIVEFRKDGPWDLPQGWAWVRLSDVTQEPIRLDPAAAFVKTFQYIDLSAISDGAIHDVKSVPAVEAPSRARQAVRSGDTLLSCVRVYLQNNAIVPPELDGQVASTAFCVLRPSEVVEPRYLFWFVHSREFAERLIPLQRGNSPPAVLDAVVRDQLIAIPPLLEQRRIVARIDELFTEIADGEIALGRARTDLGTWRRAFLKAAVTGELTREWRERNIPSQTGADIVSRLREQRPTVPSTRNQWTHNDDEALPTTWAWAAMEEVGDVQLGRQRAPQHHSGKNMRPYLRVANVLENALDLRDVKSMNFTPDEFKVFSLIPGDILLNEGQSPSLLGRPAIYRGEIDGCCFQKTLLQFRAQEGIAPEFALVVFRHYMHSGRFRRESRITTNIAHLTQVRFVVMEFPVPPIKEQLEIVRLAETYETESTEQIALGQDAEVAKLRQSILKTAFEGQLVDQDPVDEPATQLLTRLSTRIAPTAKTLRRHITRAPKAAQ